MGLKQWAQTKLLQSYLSGLKEKAMGHKAKTWMEGLLGGLAVVLLGYASENASLLFGDRKAFLVGLTAVALAAAKGYVVARYATPPDIKEKIETGEFPERRDLVTRQQRTDGTQEPQVEVIGPDPEKP